MTDEEAAAHRKQESRHGVELTDLTQQEAYLSLTLL